MTGNDINARLARLSPAKRALLERRLKQDNADRTTVVTIPRRGQQSAPLSFAQQRLWFISQLEPEGCTYNETSALLLDGDLSIQALHGALNAIVERHEILRTCYSMAENGDPVQIVGAVKPVELPILDISEIEESRRGAEVQRIALEFKARPFDLSKDMPLRLALIRLDKQSHILVEVKHHIASDGWSSGVFIRELAALYGRLIQNDTTPLPELPIQYADYATWQREWLRGEALERQLSYWKEHLRNVPVLELRTDRPRAAVQSNQAARKYAILSKTLVEQLKALSRQEGATLFMTALAAFQILLHRYTGQDDIVVGSPIAGRTRAELEGLIGFFVNTLVYRNDLSGDPTFNELLARVRKRALEAYEQQDLPFEKLVEELNPERSLSHSPVFQILFAVQNVPRQKLTLPGLRARPVEIDTITAKFDLFAAFVERDGSTMLRMEYNADLFNADTIERMMGHFRILLEDIVANPDRRIGELPLLSETERHQLLLDWNDTRRDLSRIMNVIELFEKQAEMTPDAIAVVFEKSCLTYEELNQRANELAHDLIRRGVLPETLVAVYLERSFDLVIALLAILKAGGVYVPLDPKYPKERITLMLRDMRAPFVVSVQSLTSQLSLSGIKSIFMESVRQDIAGEERYNPGLAITSGCAAYVLYTSGSTGKPKGVVMRHGALVNLISWQVENFRAPLTARTLQFAPLGFDVSLQEIFATWCAGGSLFLIKDELRRDGLGFLQFLDEQSIERIFLPFVALQNLADAAAYGNHFPRSLREIITAGEQLQLTESLRSFLDRLGGCCLRNQYGPTESHVATELVLEPPFSRWPDLPPIGRPIANAEIYLLDSRFNPVPIGVAGEIYIGGAGVAREYLNQPELTEQKFITHSFAGEVNRRMYKTGDLARYLPDGNIEFLGRIDNQVKIRGFRIEPGEIETVLSQCTGVRESAVIAWVNHVGEKCLVAYVQANENARLNSQSLRSHLKEKLPEYMVPSIFIFSRSLPLTPSGKLDRSALPEPDRGQIENLTGYAPPRTTLEQVLGEIWADVLGRERVGIHDNLFELGGHSLMAIRLISEVCKELQIELPLRRLFECPTVAGLAEIVDAEISRATMDRRATSPWRYLIELKPGQGKQPVFFLPGGIGGDDEFLVYARLTHFVGDQFRFYGLRARSADGVESAHNSVEEMATDYLKEIRMLQPEGPYFIVGNCIGGIVAYEIAQQLTTHNQAVALLALMDTWRPTARRYSRYLKDRFLSRLKEQTPKILATLRDNYYLLRLRFHWRRWQQMGWRDKFPYLLRKTAVALSESTEVLSKSAGALEKLALVTDTRRSNLQEGYVDALRRYRPRPYAGRAVMLVNEQAAQGDPTLGWERLITGGVDIREIPGDHDTYIRKHVKTAADVLTDCLTRASRYGAKT